VNPDSDPLHAEFYQSLNTLEKEAWHHLAELFQQVSPQKPEKGIRTLILRARDDAEKQGLPLEEALKRMLAGATERTLRRAALLSQCGLSAHNAVVPTENK
jgi:hypothetical protein